MKCFAVWLVMQVMETFYKVEKIRRNMWTENGSMSWNWWEAEELRQERVKIEIKNSQARNTC